MTRDGDSSNNGSGKSALPDELLQRYFDGELSAGESADVETRLDGDTDARLRLEALSELRSLLRASASAESAHVDFSSTLEAIARKAQEAPAPAPAKKRRGLIPLSAVGGFLAAAAALAFMMIPVHRSPTNEAEVETLEVQGALATVFRVPDGTDSNRTTTVIWASLDEDAASAIKPGAAGGSDPDVGSEKK